MRIQRYLRIRVSINPLHPKINMHILHNVFHNPSGADEEILLKRVCQ